MVVNLNQASCQQTADRDLLLIVGVLLPLSSSLRLLVEPTVSICSPSLQIGAGADLV
jgi:hypothetical protein